MAMLAFAVQHSYGASVIQSFQLSLQTCGEWAIASHGRLLIPFVLILEILFLKSLYLFLLGGVGHCFAWQVTRSICINFVNFI